MQTRAAVQRRAAHHGVTLIALDIRQRFEFTDSVRAEFNEELPANDAGALICNSIPEAMIDDALYRAFPSSASGRRASAIRRSLPPIAITIWGALALLLAEELGGRATFGRWAVFAQVMARMGAGA